MKAGATRAVQRAVEVTIIVMVDGDEDSQAENEQTRQPHPHGPTRTVATLPVISRADYPHTLAAGTNSANCTPN
jgi:hypothetical protein